MPSQNNGRHTALGSFPTTRLRRPRQAEWSRRLVRENTLTVDDLIWPVFVQAGEDSVTPIESMPGQFRYSVDRLIDAVREAHGLGIPAVAIFPFVDPALKTPACEEAYNRDNLVCRAVQAVKNALPEIGVICDVALDPFSSHGHDGVMAGEEILNDETLEVLCRQALVQAEAGCDIQAPSDMMDGRVGAIRTALDESGFDNTQIMSYAAKYASAFYGPFRDAIGSKGALKGDKKTYQMDPGNTDEAIREVGLDIAEGADSVMVKPGLPYLDVVRRVKDAYGVPTFVYMVSGEYAMLRGAADQGWLDWDRVVLETLLGCKRAGADGVLTYTAVDAAKLLRS